MSIDVVKRETSTIPSITYYIEVSRPPYSIKRRFLLILFFLIKMSVARRHGRRIGAVAGGGVALHYGSRLATGAVEAGVKYLLSGKRKAPPTPPGKSKGKYKKTTHKKKEGLIPKVSRTSPMEDLTDGSKSHFQHKGKASKIYNGYKLVAPMKDYSN